MSQPEPQDLETGQENLTHPPSSTLPATSLPPPVVDPGSNHPRRVVNGNRTRSSRRSQQHRSRSSNSRSRSRHRFSSSLRSSHRSRSYFKENERNWAAATCSMVTVVLLCTSLEPSWISLTGGECHILRSPKGSMQVLSTRQFFYQGHFYKNYPLTSEGDTVYKFGDSANDIMVNCVTYSAVLLFKASIAFTLIAVIFSFLAFLLDLSGPTYHVLKLLRRNAIFNILTVVMCVTVNLFIYWITSAVQHLQLRNRLHKGSSVEVTFSASFYLITAAGGVSVLATACNCLKRHTVYESETFRHREQSYLDDTEALLPPTLAEEDTSPLSNLPPPPPYVP